MLDTKEAYFFSVFLWSLRICKLQVKLIKNSPGCNSVEKLPFANVVILRDGISPFLLVDGIAGLAIWIRPLSSLLLSFIWICISFTSHTKAMKAAALMAYSTSDLSTIHAWCILHKMQCSLCTNESIDYSLWKWKRWLRIRRIRKKKEK